jgi:hypothetical protein
LALKAMRLPPFPLRVSSFAEVLDVALDGAMNAAPQAAGVTFEASLQAFERALERPALEYGAALRGRAFRQSQLGAYAARPPTAQEKRRTV